MRRFAILLFVTALPLAAACGSGKSASDLSSHDITSTATSTAPARNSTPTSVDSSGIVPLFFQNALSEASSSGSSIEGLGQGDSALEKYLLTQADLPVGYTLDKTITARVPDGISKIGGGDMAASTATMGDAASPNGDMLVSMVMRFDDLQNLDSAFGSITPAQIQSQLDQLKDVPSGLFANLHTLDTTGLGDPGHSAGVAVTMDLNGLFQAIASSLDKSFGNPTEPAAVPTVSGTIQMDMYFFGRGSYAGALMHISFGTPSGVNELGLA